MTATGDELLDLDIQPRRVEGPRFELLTAANITRGTLAIDKTHPPRIRNDVAASMPRTLDGLRILPRTRADAASPFYFAEDVNTVTERVRVIWTVGPGGTGYEWSWGIFLFGDEDQFVRTSGNVLDCQLVDQTQITGQTVDESVVYGAGASISDAIEAQADAAGIVATSIDPSTATLSAPVVGLAGRDSHDQIMRALCKAAGFLRPYFDNDGTLVARPAPDLATATADHAYGIGSSSSGRVARDTVHHANGTLRAPNRYVVRDTSLSASELVGTFDVPDSAEHSFVNIGYRRVKYDDVQGLADQDAADNAAAALYAEDSGVFASTTFESPIDPRHDTFDVVAFDAVNFLEQEWAARLAPGGRMSHDIRRIYS